MNDLHKRIVNKVAPKFDVRNIQYIKQGESIAEEKDVYISCTAEETRRAFIHEGLILSREIETCDGKDVLISLAKKNHFVEVIKRNTYKSIKKKPKFYHTHSHVKNFYGGVNKVDGCKITLRTMVNIECGDIVFIRRNGHIKSVYVQKG